MFAQYASIPQEDHYNGNYRGHVAEYPESDHTCRFVTRSYKSSYEDTLVDDSDFDVYRSTPENNQFVVPTPMIKEEHATTSTVTIPKVCFDFKPIAEVEEYPSGWFPGVNHAQHTASTVATPLTTTEWHQSDTLNTYRGRKTPILPSAMQQDMTEPDEDTILNRSATLQQPNEEEDGRQSPFGPAPVVALEQVYCYNACKNERDEMERMKWQLHHQYFQRRVELEQREPYWGTLQLRDGRVFFHPGTQREMILREQKFFEQSLKHGDPEWNARRRTERADVLARFTREETQHKQALMRAHLEQGSAFFNLPILANRFLLIRLLGKGGNAEVWEVIDFAKEKRSCALKLSGSHKHARREHYTHSQLHHHNIVQVDDTAYTIDYQDQLYTAFTVDSGETDLQQLIELHGHVEEATALQVLSQLLNAVTYLHITMRIAHYDIKPTNILVGWGGESIKLTDFDLARRVDEPIKSSVVGTLRYLPPECFRPNFGACQATAEKADIWMIGIVYCVLLCGQHPIIAEKASADTARSTLGRYNGRMDHFNAGHVSEVSRWIIQGCLDPDPRRRPTALELLQALQHTVGT